MKKILLLAIVAVMSLGANAQLISSNTVTKMEKKNYKRLGVSYTSLDAGGDDAMSGVALEWLKGISVSSTNPLFVEFGLNASYNWYSKNSVDSKYVAVAIPVNLTYRYELNDNVRISPYVGAYGRVGVYGLTETDGYYGTDEYDWFEDLEYDRFQYGLKLGANLEYNNVYLGLGYAFDLNAVQDHADKFSIFNVTLGLTF